MATDSSQPNNKPSLSQEFPTIVLVQGSFQTSLFYESLVQNLEALGDPTLQPPLPSWSDPDNPNFSAVTLIDDALTIRKELIRHVEYFFNYFVLFLIY